MTEQRCLITGALAGSLDGCGECDPCTDPNCWPDIAKKEHRLADTLAMLQQAEHKASCLAKERDHLIRELVAQCGYGSGARLARLTGLTRVRIHQIAKGSG